MSLLHAAGGDLNHVLHVYGYWGVALLVFLESMGVPSPGETMLIAAGVYAGATHHLQIGAVILTAWGAAVLGDNLGYWIGREGGWRLLRRYGRLVHVDDGTLKIGMYLFRRHGGTVVFVGRFLPLLRTWGAVLAGVNRFSWPRFLFWNATSAAAWATAWGLLSYAFGNALQHLQSLISLIAFGVALVVTVVTGVVLAKQRRALLARAERAFPGSLEDAARRPVTLSPVEG